MIELNFLRNWVQRLRHVQWFNMNPRLLSMSVAEHSYITAVVVMLMSEDLPAQEQLTLLRAALLHDLEEGFTGDVSSLVKRLDGNFAGAWRQMREEVMTKVIIPPELGHLMEDWQAGGSERVKAADLVSMWLFASEEADMGNGPMRIVCGRLAGWLEERAVETLWLQPWVRAIQMENAGRGIGSSLE